MTTEPERPTEAQLATLYSWVEQDMLPDRVVFEAHHRWWFFDADWHHVSSPFPTQAAAEQALRDWLDYLDDPTRFHDDAVTIVEVDVNPDGTFTIPTGDE